MKLRPDLERACYELAGVTRPPRPSKYGNRPVYHDSSGQVCGRDDPGAVKVADSEREFARWLVLKAMERDGLIRDLKRQVTVPLVVNGVLVCRFVADFEYWDVAAERIIHDDSKGFRTKEYRIKAKLYRALYGVPIRET